MGNITKRGGRELAAARAQAPEGGPSAALPTRLYEAIMREDRAALQALLRSHPVNQPMTLPADSASYRLLPNQVASVPAPSLRGKKKKKDAMLQKERHLTPENPPRFPAARAVPEAAQATPAQSRALLSLRCPLPGVTRALMGAETRARLAGRTPTPRCWFCLQARMIFVPFF